MSDEQAEAQAAAPEPESSRGSDPAAAVDLPLPPIAVAPAPAGAPSVLAARRAAFLAFAKRNAKDAAILGALGALCALVVVLRLDGVSSGGDAIRKWHFVRQWFYANDFSRAHWDHHMARFGVNGVTFIVQSLLGRGATIYFVPSILATVVQVLFVYACGKRLDSRAAGVLGALCFIYFPGTPHAGSQLLPEVFSGTYAIVALYLYLRYTDAVGPRRTAWLCAMSVTMFVDYLAKETSVFFIPGFALAIWLAGTSTRARLRDLSIFCGILAIGAICETGFYRIFTEYPHRFAVITENHIPGEEAMSSRTMWDLLQRYAHLDNPWRVACFSLLATSLGVLAFGKTFRTTSLYAIVAGYFFFLTFLVRSLHPITVWQSYRLRYFDPTIPFVMLVTGIFFALVVRAIRERHAGSWGDRLLARVDRFGAPIVVACCVWLGWSAYRDARPDLAENALVLTKQMSVVASDAYRRGLPIVSVSKDRRGVWVAYAVFIDDRLLARKRHLPDFDDVKQTDGRRDYLVKQPELYDADKLRKLVRQDCAVSVSTKAGLQVDMVPMARLPRSCDDALARILQ